MTNNKGKERELSGKKERENLIKGTTECEYWFGLTKRLEGKYYR